MTVIWLIVWLCSGTPALHAWNSWLVALLVCAGIDLIDLFGGSRAAS